jgi:hypothetical protein
VIITSDHRSGVIVTGQLRIVCEMFFQEQRNGCAMQLVGLYSHGFEEIKTPLTGRQMFIA